jgi:hypothetical protein
MIYQGTPPFFIQGYERGGGQHIAGHCHDGATAGRLMEKMGRLASIYNDLIGFAEDATTEQRLDRRWDAYEKLRLFDPLLTPETTHYQVVYIMNYDTDLKPEAKALLDEPGQPKG